MGWALLSLLDDSEALVRWAATKALRKITVAGAPGGYQAVVVQALTEQIADQNDNVQREIVETLNIIGAWSPSTWNAADTVDRMAEILSEKEPINQVIAGLALLAVRTDLSPDLRERAMEISRTYLHDARAPRHVLRYLCELSKTDRKLAARFEGELKPHLQTPDDEIQRTAKEILQATD